nr:G-type lectin S-receptor-like serine/threonine-protein kinase [Ipomoea batatas]
MATGSRFAALEQLADYEIDPTQEGTMPATNIMNTTRSLPAIRTTPHTQKQFVPVLEIPILDSSRGVFVIKEDGNLYVLNGTGATYFSTQLDATGASKPHKTARTARLLDSENLVLIDNLSRKTLWQIFDNPTDTFLPVMKIDDPNMTPPHFPGFANASGVLNWFPPRRRIRRDPVLVKEIDLKKQMFISQFMVNNLAGHDMANFIYGLGGSYEGGAIDYDVSNVQQRKIKIFDSNYASSIIPGKKHERMDFRKALLKENMATETESPGKSDQTSEEQDLLERSTKKSKRGERLPESHRNSPMMDVVQETPLASMAEPDLEENGQREDMPPRQEEVPKETPTHAGPQRRHNTPKMNAKESNWKLAPKGYTRGHYLAPHNVNRGRGGRGNPPRRAAAETEHVVVHGSARGRVITRTTVHHHEPLPYDHPTDKPLDRQIGFLDMEDPPPPTTK